MGSGGTGRRKIEIKKITKQSSKNVTFSKRRKGLFKKAEEIQSKAGASISIVVFSPANRPYTQGDLSLFDAVDGCSAAKTTVSRGYDAGRVGDATPTSSLIRLENMDVEGYRNLNELMSLEKELEDLREGVIHSEFFASI
ncbi:MADS-box domain-containing protein [Abeliophyllum distichum]|uniref:MADS-box domain-containing protein n=1 Tax=Abeliophyllum distichum TaxID=126358 RepID=A0ABD1V5G4_9LAMI